MKKRLLSIALTLSMLLSLLPTTALAADPSYDSDQTHFSYYLVRYTSGEVTEWDLRVQGYTGSSTHAQIPDTVTVATAPGISTSYKAELATLGITTLPVRRVEHFSAATLTHLRLGANVEELYEGAFSDSYAPLLREVDIPANSALQRITRYAFQNATLERVGVEGTTCLPASLTQVYDYAFYKTDSLQTIDFSQTGVTDIGDCMFCNSGIQSIVLPSGLTGIDMNAFGHCVNLTEVTVPAGVSYFGSYVFSDCRNLRSVTFLGAGASMSQNAYCSLRGLPEDCTVYVPRPSQADYSKQMDRLYEHMGLNARARVCWLGESSTMSLPTINAAAAVTLTGTGAPDFTYDFNDTNGDGLGGILYIDGRGNDWTLTIDKSKLSSTDRVTWISSAAYYDNRAGTDDGVVLRGTALTENMRRNSRVSDRDTERITQNLSINLSEKFSIYYYFPVLIHEGSASTPQRSTFGAPIAVVYRPTTGTNNETTLRLNGGSGGAVNHDAQRVDGNYGLLEYGISFFLPGVENMGEGGENRALTPGVTALNFPNAQITYQWRYEKDGNWFNVSGGSGTAVYSGYSNVSGDGLLWETGAIPHEQLEAMCMDLAPYGSRAIRLDITGTVNGQSVQQSTGIYYLNVYSQLEYNQPHSFDLSDMTDWEQENLDLHPVNGSYTPGSYSNPYPIKRGTQNAYLKNYYTQDKLGSFRGHLEYQWNYYLSGHPETQVDCGTQEYFDLSLLPDDVAADTEYVVSCRVILFGEGAGYALSSINAPVSFRVLAEEAELPWEEESGNVHEKVRIVFDEAKQRELQLVNEQEELYSGAETVLFVHLQQGMLRQDNPRSSTIFEVYEADSPEQNRGGRLLFTTSAWEEYINYYTGEYERDTVNGDASGHIRSGGDSINGVLYKGEFAIPLKNGSENFYFDSYGARYVYIRARNEGRASAAEDPKLFSVAYSPTFLILPGYGAVAEDVPLPETGMEVIRMSEPDVWLKQDTDGDRAEMVTLSAKLRLRNIPPVYEVPGTYMDAQPLFWTYHERSSGDLYPLDDAANWSEHHGLYSYSDMEHGGTAQRLNVESISVAEDGSYIATVTAELDINLYAEGSGGYCYLDPEDGSFDAQLQGWRVALQVDPTGYLDNWDNGYEPVYTPVTRLHLADASHTPHNLSVSVSGDGTVGGKGVWDATARAYQVNPLGADGAPLIPEDEYWIYSEEFDWCWPEDDNNQSESGPLLFTAPYTGTLGEGETFLWRILTAGEMTRPSILYYADYLAPGERTELSWADCIGGAENPTHSWGDSYLSASVVGGVPTLTVDTPHGTSSSSAVRKNLEITPMVVTNWDAEHSSYDTAQFGPTQTLRVNRSRDTVNPSVASGYGELHINTGNPGAALPYGQSVSVYSTQGTTYCRLYRTQGSGYNMAQDTPVTAWQVLENTAYGYGTYHFELTEDEVAALREELPDGRGSVMYYLVAYNEDTTSPGKQRSDYSYGKVTVVSLGDYKVLSEPTVTPFYIGPDEIDYTPGLGLPEGLMRLTTRVPWTGSEQQGTIRQEIRYDYVIRNAANGNVLESNTDMLIFRISRNCEKNEIDTSQSSSNDSVIWSLAADGTLSVELTEASLQWSGILNRVRQDVGAAYDVELTMRVENSVWGVATEYADGGDASEWLGRTVTVRQRPLAAPSITSFQLDKNAMGALQSRPYGMGGSGMVSSFRQSGDYYRPVTFQVTAPEELCLRPYLEYWSGYQWTQTEEYQQDFYDAAGTRVAHYDCLTSTGEEQAMRLQLPYREEWETEDGLIFLRVRMDVSTSSGWNIGEDASAASAYSEVFAMLAVEGDRVDAELPQEIPNVLDDSPLWQVGGASPTTSLTIGAEDAWTVSRGTLSYRWERLDAENNTYVTIEGATGPTYTVPQAEVQSAIDKARTSGERQYCDYYLIVINTDDHPEITGYRERSSSKRICVSVTQAAELPVLTGFDASAVTMVGGGAPLELNVSVANAAACGDLTYAWYARVVDDGTERPGYPGALAENAYNARFQLVWSDSTGAAEWIPAGGRLSIYDYDEETSSYKDYYSQYYVRDNGGANDLWNRFDGPITLEVWCEVTNEDSSIPSGGYQYRSAETARKLVTLTKPSALPDGTLSADKNLLGVDECTTLRLSGVSAQNGGTLHYTWYRSNTPDFAEAGELYGYDSSSYEPYSQSSSKTEYYWVKVSERAGYEAMTQRIYGSVMLRTVGEQAEQPALSGTSTVYGAVGESVTLSVSAHCGDGGSLSYRWERWDGSSWQPIVGETAASLSGVSLPDEPGEGAKHRVIVTNTNTAYAEGKQTSESSMVFTPVAKGWTLSLLAPFPTVLVGDGCETEVEVRYYGEEYPNYVQWSINTPRLSLPETSGWNRRETYYASQVTMRGEAITGDINATLSATVKLQGESATTLTVPVTVTTAAAIIEQGSLMLGRYGEPIAAGTVLSARSSTGPLSGTWTYTGTLPEGVSFSGGAFSGTPRFPGRYSVSVSFTGGGYSLTRSVDLLVRTDCATAGNYGGGSSSNLVMAGSDERRIAELVAGSGWHWDEEVGMLYLDSCVLDALYVSEYRYGGSNYPPYWIHLSGASSVTLPAASDRSAAIYSDNPIYLIGDGDLTLTGNGRNQALYSNVLTLTAGYSGTLTAQNDGGALENVIYTAYCNELTVEEGSSANVSIAVIGGRWGTRALYGTLTHRGSGYVYINANASQSDDCYGIYGDVTVRGSGSVSVTANAEQTQSCCGVRGDVTASGSGSVSVTANGGWNTFGVDGSVDHSGSGSVSVNAFDGEEYIYGVTAPVTHSGSGALSVTAAGDGNDPARYSYALSRGITTSGTGNITLRAENCQYAYGFDHNGTYPITLGHSGGKLSVTATGVSDSSAVRQISDFGYAAGKSAANYRIEGDPESGFVSYLAADPSALYITPEGPISLQATLDTPITPLLLRGSGESTLQWTLTGAPAGLSLEPAADGLSATLHGAPTQTGSFAATVTLTNGTLSTTATVNILVASTTMEASNGPLVRIDNAGELWLPYLMGEDENASFAVDIFGTTPQSVTVTSGDEDVFTVDVKTLTPASYGSPIRIWPYLRPAAGAVQGESATLTLRGYDGPDGTGNVIVEQSYTVNLACAAPAYAYIDNSYYYDLWYSDHSGNGWAWDHTTGILTLEDFDGYSIVTSDDTTALRALQVNYSGTNRVEVIDGDSTYNNHITLRATAPGSSLTVDTYIKYLDTVRFIGGNVSLRFANSGLVNHVKHLILQDVESFCVDTGDEEHGYAMDGDVSVELAMTKDYYFLGAPNDWRYLCGTELTPALLAESYAVSGEGQLHEGESATLIAPSLNPLYLLRDKDGAALMTARNTSYQWQQKLGGVWQDLPGETGSILSVAQTDIGEIGTSGEYRCCLSYTDSGLPGTLSAVTQAHSIAVTPEGVSVSGGSGNHGDPGHTPGVQAHSNNEAWLKGDTTVTITETTDPANTAAETLVFADGDFEVAAGVSHEDYNFDTVEEGTYTVRVEKEHFAPVEVEVTVGAADVAVDTIDLYMWGDVNKNGTRNSADALLVLRQGNTLTGYDKEIGDVNGNGAVNSADALLILRTPAAGNFPVETT